MKPGAEPGEARMFTSLVEEHDMMCGVGKDVRIQKCFVNSIMMMIDHPIFVYGSCMCLEYLEFCHENRCHHAMTRVKTEYRRGMEKFFPGLYF